MRCQQCGHVNITAFEFCEQCLAMLPDTGWEQRRARSRDPFDFEEESLLESKRVTSPIEFEERDTSRFPWNPEKWVIDTLLGRDRELKQAIDKVESVIKEWTGNHLLVLGGRGIGTSTFLARFEEKALKVDRDLVWIQAWCRDEPTRPYGVFGRLLRNRLSIPVTHDDWMCGERLEHEVIELYGEDRTNEAREISHLVAFLVGFKIEGSPYLAPSAADTETLIPRASQALTRLLCKMAFNRPLVLAIDEAQRATAPLLALIDLINEGTTSAPILLVVAGRPELQKAQPEWEHRPTISLKALGKQDATAVLKHFLQGIESVPEELLQRVVDKAGGNPYAIRMIIRYLHETGAISPADNGERWVVDETIFFDLDIPDTLKGVADARLQSLTPGEKAVLQQAAISVNHFWFGSLVMMQRQSSDRSVLSASGVGKDRGILDLKKLLVSLCHREILVRTEDKSLPGEESYAFCSDLDREILYEQCPASTRQRFHRMLAHWIELQPTRFVESHLSHVAHHLEIGGEKVKSAQYYNRAGRRARDHHNNEQAITFYEHALRLTGEEEVASRMNILHAMGNLYRTLGRFEMAIEIYREMLRYAWIMRSRNKGAVALNKLGQLLRSTGEYDAARDHLVKALQLFRAVHDTRGIAGVLDDMGQLDWLTGETQKALVTYERSKKLRIQMKDPRGLSLTMHYIGCAHLELGNTEAATRHLRDALALRRKHKDLTGTSLTLNNLGVIHWNQGDASKAREAWRESLQICREVGNRPVQSMLMNNLAESHIIQADFSAAVMYLEEAERIAEQAKDRRTLSSVLVNAARVALYTGKHAAAIACGHRAADEARSIGNKRILGMALVTLGEITIGTAENIGESSDIPEGLKQMREGIQILANAECEVDQAAGLEQLSMVLNQLGRTQSANEALEEANAIYTRLKVRPPSFATMVKQMNAKTKAPQTIDAEAVTPEITDGDTKSEKTPENAQKKRQSTGKAKKTTRAKSGSKTKADPVKKSKSPAKAAKKKTKGSRRKKAPKQSDK